MNLANITQKVFSKQVENDKYYDLILFVSELSPQNDFSFHYIDDYVLFENLSYEGIKFFLNRFKNFDIVPINLYGLRSNLFKFSFNVNSIYEKFYNKIKVELPINKCSDCTLNILNSLQFLIDVFQSLDYLITVNERLFELSDLDQCNLPIVVSKMRSIQLKPRKINFSSKFLFQLVFDLEDIVRLIGKSDSGLLELENGRNMINKELTRKGITGGENNSHYESALSTDEFPTSLESTNGEKFSQRKYFENNIENDNNVDESLTNIDVSVKKTAKKRKGGNRGRPRVRCSEPSVRKKNAVDKYAISNIDNDSLMTNDPSKDDLKTIKKRKWNRRTFVPREHRKRSERLKRKEVCTGTELVKVKKPRASRKNRELTTDIDGSPYENLNLISTTFDASNQHKSNSLSTTIDSVLERFTRISNAVPCTDLIDNSAEKFTVKQESIAGCNLINSNQILSVSMPPFMISSSSNSSPIVDICKDHLSSKESSKVGRTPTKKLRMKLKKNVLI